MWLLVGAPVQTEQSKDFPLGAHSVNVPKDMRDNKTQCLKDVEK